MKKLLLLAALIFSLAGGAGAQTIPLLTGPAGVNPANDFTSLPDINKLIGQINTNTVLNGSLPFTPPNVFPVCGSDSTTIIQAALNNAATNRGTVALPPCQATSGCFIISATLLIPSNTSLLGTGKSVTCIKAAANLNAPLFANQNFNGAGSITLDSNIELGFLTIDGNAANQVFALANKCVEFIGVDRPSVHDLEVDNCISGAVHFDGNSSTTTNGGFVNNIFVNSTVGNGSNPLAGIGLQVSNAQRGMQVANITTLNTNGYGVLIDASEGNWSSIHTKGAGTGLICPNSGITTVNNPGGGGTPQSGWTPCSAGIYVRNVADVNGVDFLATEGQYYGVVITGCRHCAISGLVATDNSLRTNNVWDDLHLDLNIFLTSGRGENHNLTINGVVVGANGQLGGTASPTNAVSAATSRNGVFIADGMAGSVGDATIVTPGTGCTINDSYTTSGGTFSIAAKWTAGNVISGAVTGLKHDYTTGGGVYTILPPNPVTLSGGTCSVPPTINILWSKAILTGVTVGQTSSGNLRLPSFFTNWSLQSNAGNFGPLGPPTLSSCGGGSPTITAGSTGNIGQFTVGTATATCTMTFAQPFTSSVRCVVNSESTLAAFGYTYSLTALVVTATVLGGDVVDYNCQGN